MSAGRDGCHHVLVNGEGVILDGALTKARPGRVVRGPAAAGFEAR